MKTEKLKKYQDRVKKWQSAIINKDRFSMEQNTIIKFVLPLLEILGWDRLYQEMEFEYRVKGDKKGRVDIALFTDNSQRPKTFVEVKPICGTTSGLTRGTQLLKYLKRTDVKYGIYTNGKEIKVVGKQGVRDGYSPTTLFHLRAEHFVDYKDVLGLLTKAFVKKRALDKLAINYQKNFCHWKKQHKTQHAKDNRTEYDLQLMYVRNRLKE